MCSDVLVKDSIVLRFTRKDRVGSSIDLFCSLIFRDDGNHGTDRANMNINHMGHNAILYGDGMMFML